MTHEDRLTPAIIVAELDKYIVGQNEAKKAVAIALRNRWRRARVDPSLRQEITPKNILMIGPTGVGKTEIARRLAKLVEAPFLKVEATKFTEVGYVGRDVESIIRDLIEIAVKETREKAKEAVMVRAQDLAEERVLDALLPRPHGIEQEHDATWEKFRMKLRAGELDDKTIEIDVAAAAPQMEIFGPPGMEEITSQIQQMFQGLSGIKRKPKKLKVAEALHLLIEEEAARLVDEDAIRQKAREQVEEQGIVFIDEIDKITARGETTGADVSREGVQRDLLPLIEGTTVSTKYGMVKTDHILFIASGAFQLAKPSDLIPELQGRLPIRVELASLKVEDFEKILTQTDACLIRQYKALLGTEGVVIEFSDDAVRKIAEIAYRINETTENIGARRLYTVMERLLEDLSFEADQKAGDTIAIDGAYVASRLEEVAKDEDLARYVL